MAKLFVALLDLPGSAFMLLLVTMLTIIAVANTITGGN